MAAANSNVVKHTTAGRLAGDKIDFKTPKGAVELIGDASATNVSKKKRADGSTLTEADHLSCNSLMSGDAAPPQPFGSLDANAIATAAAVAEARVSKPSPFRMLAMGDADKLQAYLESATLYECSKEHREYLSAGLANLRAAKPTNK